MDDQHPMDRQIQELLRSRFHLHALYPYQELVIRTILESDGLYGAQAQHERPRRQLVVLPTGSGKSVCFMLPSLLIEGLTLVVYPLLSLMNDQARRVGELGEHAAILRGGQSNAHRTAIWNAVDTKRIRFLITNPETLRSPKVLSHISRYPVSLMVIDEAHTVVQWGESFRPSYLELAACISVIRPHQVLAFTATASERIIAGITRRLFSNRPVHLVNGNPDRPNISYRVLPSLAKMHEIEMLLRYSIQIPALLFCASRRRCESFAWEINLRIPSLAVRYYHAGLDVKEREATERWFFHARHAVLCCTNAYGMGVDKKGIRTIIHVDLPQDVESYLQESGRGGRDGKSAASIVLMDYEQFLHPSGTTEGRQQLSVLFSDRFRCRREALLALMGFTQDSCSDCDICNKRRIDTPDGLYEILRLIRRYPLRFSESSAAYLLCGTYDHNLLRPIDRTNVYAGLLDRWYPDDLKQAIHSLVEMGYLHASRWIFLKGRLRQASPRATRRPLMNR